MRKFATTFLLVFIMWTVLTFTLDAATVIAGVVLSFAISFICRHLLARDTPRIILHPARWVGFLVYVGMMLWVEARSHLHVMRLVFTGRVRPAILEVPVGLNTNLGKTLIANSITMTPGTVTIDARDEDRFYVHTIYHRKGQDIGSIFNRYGARVIG